MATWEQKYNTEVAAHTATKAALATLQARWEEAQRLILMHQGFDNTHAAALRVIADKLTTP